MRHARASYLGVAIAQSPRQSRRRRLWASQEGRCDAFLSPSPPVTATICMPPPVYTTNLYIFAVIRYRRSPRCESPRTAPCFIRLRLFIYIYYFYVYILINSFIYIIYRRKTHTPYNTLSRRVFSKR